jgi:hypothetical protein
MSTGWWTGFDLLFEPIHLIHILRIRPRIDGILTSHMVPNPPLFFMNGGGFVFLGEVSVFLE